MVGLMLVGFLLLACHDLLQGLVYFIVKLLLLLAYLLGLHPLLNLIYLYLLIEVEEYLVDFVLSCYLFR